MLRGITANGLSPSTSGRQGVKCQPVRIGTKSRRSLTVNARRSIADRGRKPPPPDLPSLLFDQRIVYLGMPLVPAVTELIVAELLYLEKQGQTLPIEMLINSSGTTRQDGQILAFDSEGIAMLSAMGFVRNPISTVNMGLAVGWSAAVLAFGKKGWRKSLPHSLVGKLDHDMQRPLYMRPQDALQYNIIDEVIQPNRMKEEKAAAYWLKSGRAETEGRLEQWFEYLSLQQQQLVSQQGTPLTSGDAPIYYDPDGTSSTLGGGSISPAAEGEVDYEALIKAVDAMDPAQFATVNMDSLVAQYTR
ncbi:ClpP/crotonase-like domain-containing protein [Dunaliella salina]|uniref:ATP-dependent Clp protease proteolytic subunit n=1 Tax=Dunaliella salina TaxID=3046 RepID=A0ABQ7GX52_DUNSA|nr:ClpP/crotonase-like domain-containing protein [Dunaliella salina]|eukprot:KAF5839186.1 ClpP/crotonase-like domain-containing protein [Dunaliella salina]